MSPTSVEPMNMTHVQQQQNVMPQHLTNQMAQMQLSNGAVSLIFVTYDTRDVGGSLLSRVSRPQPTGANICSNNCEAIFYILFKLLTNIAHWFGLIYFN